MNGETHKYFILIIAVFFIVISINKSLSFYESNKDNEPTKERDRLMSYIIQCYATEGVYPPSLEYLENNYGFRLNKNKFDYFYDVFASNVRPDLVIKKKLDSSNSEKMTEALYGY